MRTKKCHARRWLLISSILWLVLMMVTLSFSQEQPEQNQPAPSARAMRPEAASPGPQGMPGRGMRGGGGPGMPGGPDMGQRDSDLMRPDIQKELGITAEQRQRLEDIRFNSEKESIQHSSALRIQRMELSRLIDAENPDRNAIDKKIQEVAQEEASLMRSSVNAHLSARPVLTAEQRSKLAQLRQNRPQGRPPGGRGDRPPGQPTPMAGQPKERMP
jgi:Spy/CpxP family protein refolding chaperone